MSAVVETNRVTLEIQYYPAEEVDVDHNVGEEGGNGDDVHADGGAYEDHRTGVLGGGTCTPPRLLGALLVEVRLQGAWAVDPVVAVLLVVAFRTLHALPRPCPVSVPVVLAVLVAVDRSVGDVGKERGVQDTAGAVRLLRCKVLVPNRLVAVADGQDHHSGHHSNFVVPVLAGQQRQLVSVKIQ